VTTSVHRPSKLVLVLRSFSPTATMGSI